MKKPTTVIELEVEGATISCAWWSSELKELFCSLCKEDGGGDCEKCLTNNPWCG